MYADRLRRFKQALIDDDIVFIEVNVLALDLSTSTGEDIANYMLALPKLPDGVFSANDQCALSKIYTKQV